MSGNTEESARFKKPFQTVNEGDNNEIVGNTNDKIFKEQPDQGVNVNNETRPVDSAIERDLETKGYTTRATDAESEETQELREQLSKPGNPS